MLGREFGPSADEKRYEWLYRNAPAGPAQVWKYEAPDGQLIGLAAAFPRQIMTATGASLCYVLGDFCVSSSQRTLGPALKLQKACMQGLAELGATVYDLPSQVMQAVYRRMGYHPGFSVVRYARPLRSGRMVNERIPNATLAGIVAGIVDFGLTLALPRSIPGTVSVDRHSTDFDVEFTSLAHEVGARWGVCGYRSGEYLNWRFAQHPMLKFVTWTARRNGKLVAYIVTAQEELVMRIVDLFGLADEQALAALVTKVIGESHGAGCGTVSFCIPENHVWCKWLSRLGFRARESNAVMVMESKATGSSWLILDGDRES